MIVVAPFLLPALAVGLQLLLTVALGPNVVGPSWCSVRDGRRCGVSSEKKPRVCGNTEKKVS